MSDLDSPQVARRHTKPQRCVVCGQEDPEEFYQNQRSRCKRHIKTLLDPEQKAVMTPPYKCLTCGEDDIFFFHLYKKDYCREHHPNSRFPTKPRDELEEIDEKEGFTHVKMPEKMSPDVVVKRSTPIPIPKRKIVIVRRG